MLRSRSLAVALVGALTLLGAGCGASAKASSAEVAATTGSTATSAASTASSASGTSASSDPSTASGAADSTGSADPAGRPPRGDGDGDGGPGGRGPGGPGGFGDLAAAATAIGVSEDELRTAVDGGQTIAQVAAAKGVSTDVVVAAMVAAMKAHFDDEIASGEHTQAEVDQIMADATAMMTAIVNGEQPAFGPGGPGGDGDGDHGGFGGPGDGDGDHGGDDGQGGDPSGSTGRKANTGASSSTIA